MNGEVDNKSRSGQIFILNIPLGPPCYCKYLNKFGQFLKEFVKIKFELCDRFTIFFASFNLSLGRGKKQKLKDIGH